LPAAVIVIVTVPRVTGAVVANDQEPASGVTATVPLPNDPVIQ